MTKQQIKSEALRHHYRATYSSRVGEWFLERTHPSKSARAFEAVVFANLTRQLGIDGKVVEGRANG